MNLRSRVVALTRVPAKDLRANPKNWRTHPAKQREAVEAILQDVGIADAMLARRADDGSLVLIDGHLRADIAAEQEIPVLLLDVTEAEADKLLATLDAITQMAGFDRAKLDALLSAEPRREDALEQLLDELAAKAALSQENDEATDTATVEVDVDGFKMTHQCKECGLEFNA